AYSGILTSFSMSSSDLPSFTFSATRSTRERIIFFAVVEQLCGGGRAVARSWPAGVRTGRRRGDCLGIDRRGNLYWDGRPVEVRHFWLTRWQKVGAVVSKMPPHLKHFLNLPL